MSFPTPPFEEAVTCKELAYYLPNRSARWVATECKLERIKTLPVGKPYLIPPYEANRLLGYDNEDDRTRSTDQSRRVSRT